MNMCRKIITFKCAAQSVTEEMSCDFYTSRQNIPRCNFKFKGVCTSYNAMTHDGYLLSTNTYRIIPYIRSKHDLGTFILKNAKEKIKIMDIDHPDNIHILEEIK